MSDRAGEGKAGTTVGLPAPVYDRDGITLYHGDSLALLPHLPAVDAVVTDPPYGAANTAARARATKWQRAAGNGPRDWDAIPADVAPLLDLSGRLVIWGGNYYPLPPSRGWLVWMKPDAPPSMAAVELAWTSQDTNARVFTYSIGQTNAERVGHPTQKPLALMRWCVGLLGLPADSLVLDPFAGSGTTGVACRKAGMRCILIERDARYIPTIIRRLSDCETPLFASVNGGEAEASPSPRDR